MPTSIESKTSTGGTRSVQVTRGDDTIEVEYSSTGNVVLWVWSEGEIVASIILHANEAQDFFTKTLANTISHTEVAKLVRGL